MKDELKELIKKYLDGEFLVNKELLSIIEGIEVLKIELCKKVVQDNPSESDLLSVILLDLPAELKIKAEEEMLTLDNISDHYLVFLINHCSSSVSIKNRAWEIFHERYPDNHSKKYMQITSDPCGFREQ